jgi:hypothetical protein
MDNILIVKEFVFKILLHSVAQQDIKVMEMEFVLKLPQLWFLHLANYQMLFTLKKAPAFGILKIHLFQRQMKFLMCHINLTLLILNYLFKLQFRRTKNNQAKHMLLMELVLLQRAKKLLQQYMYKQFKGLNKVILLILQMFLFLLIQHKQ